MGPSPRSATRTLAFWPPKPSTGGRAACSPSTLTSSRRRPSSSSACAIASSTLSASISTDRSAVLTSLLHRPLQQQLLRDRQHVVDQPVERQSRRKVDEHHGEDEGHDHHHPLLRRIAGLR